MTLIEQLFKLEARDESLRRIRPHRRLLLAGAPSSSI